MGWHLECKNLIKKLEDDGNNLGSFPGNIIGSSILILLLGLLGQNMEGHIFIAIV